MSVAENRHIDPRYTEPHYSTKIWMAYYSYISSFYGESTFEKICTELNIPSDYLKNTSNWVSRQFAEEFIIRAKKITGDEELARKVGQSTFSPDNINHFEFMALKLMTPGMFFYLLPLEAKKVNNTDTYKVTSFKPGRIEISIVTPEAGTLFNDVTLNAVGACEACKDFYNLDKLNVYVSEVNETKRIISIQYTAYKRIGKSFLLFALFALTQYLIFSQSDFIKKFFIENVVYISALISLSLVLVCGFIYAIKKIINIFYLNLLHHDEEKTRSQKLHDSNKKLDQRYQESNLLRHLSMGLLKFATPREMIQFCLDDLNKRFGYSRSLAMLLSSENNQLYTAEARGFGEYEKYIYGLSIQYPALKHDEYFFSKILENGETVLFEDIHKQKERFNENNRALLDKLSAESMIVSPIQDGTAKYGLLVIGSLKNDRKLTADDKHLIENITRMFSLFFRNAKTLDDEKTLREIFQKYVPPVVLESLSHLKSNKGGMFLEPKSTKITSMFVDLRGFTSLAESLPPENTIEILNTYINMVTKNVAEQGGIVDNLIGDGVVVFFPENPFKPSEHAQRAVTCSLNVLNQSKEMCESFETKGYGTLGIGIGLNTGFATVGNIGSEIKINYTAVGDTVNLAARLQEFSKRYFEKDNKLNSGILVVGQSVLNAGNFTLDFAENLGSQGIRGRKSTEPVYMINNQNLNTFIKKDEILTFEKFIEVVPIFKKAS